ncbi:hypothetical protein BGX38DRAFT_1179855 [Terfezia claveryi]|nr:hypothetical protein BGX38DRAFT_1179855 [Terfezia claveryi]
MFLMSFQHWWDTGIIQKEVPVTSHNLLYLVLYSLAANLFCTYILTMASLNPKNDCTHAYSIPMFFFCFFYSHTLFYNWIYSSSNETAVGI